MKKHDVSFKEAATIFGDPLAETFLDPDHSISEYRFITIGLSELGNILVVAFTEKNDIIRIISARKANKHEKKYYENG